MSSRVKSILPPWVYRGALGNFYSKVDKAVDNPFLLDSGAISSPVSELTFNIPDDVVEALLEIKNLTAAADNVATYFLVSVDGSNFVQDSGAYVRTDTYAESLGNLVFSSFFDAKVSGTAAPLPYIPGPPVGTGTEIHKLAVGTFSTNRVRPLISWGTEPPDSPGVDPSLRVMIGGGALSTAFGRYKAFKLLTLTSTFATGSWELFGWKDL